MKPLTETLQELLDDKVKMELGIRASVAAFVEKHRVAIARIDIDLISRWQIGGHGETIVGAVRVQVEL